ncbi:MAG TPA: DUF2066 domain-containing protein [Verrucomicrobiae bacterium]|nr:DUF2066 domain-containing protein [Verrucomicrobiae bacterium]
MILRAALGMLFCLLFALPCRADNQSAMAVPGVSVDVTASDAVSAREKALLEGQRQALSQLLTQLATPADIAKLPPLSDAQITDMVADYQVESEKVSSVRYIGQITFRFRADAVSSYLGQGGITTTSVGAGPPVLVLPVLTSGGKNLLFEDGNSWLAAWNQHRPADGVVRLVLPLGDAADVAAISGDEALAGNSAKLQALATRYGVGEVVVADAKVDPGNLALATKRYTPAGAVGGFEDKFAGDPDTAYVAAIDRVATQVQQDWIAQNQVTSNVEQRLTVEAPLGSLAQWSEMNQRFAAVATLRHVDVVYLMRGRAELDLVFVGDRGQLAQALGQQGMLLQDTADGHTTLSLAGGTQP